MVDSRSIRLSLSELEEGRFSCFGRIQWWDQARLARARVLVVGAGALGNEIIKNAALLGFGHVLVVDLDRIETSNLSRSILFRPEDIGQAKAATAARAAKSIFGGMSVHFLNADVLCEVGLGVFAWADLILAGLDNREARLWLNRCAWKVNRPWIDGAIEGLSGLARVFLPGIPPCYECTLGETDWAILTRRMSCNLLSREEMGGGKVPTTPTVASIVAGLQVQEAVKWLHGLPTLAGKGYVFDGMNHVSYTVEYTQNPDCLSHETYSVIVPWAGTSARTTLQELYAFAQDQLGAREVVLEFSRDVVKGLMCPRCQAGTDVFTAVGALSSAAARCPHDGEQCVVQTVHNYRGVETWGNRPLNRLGLPLFDMFVARSAAEEKAILIEGDGVEVLGPLAQGARPPETTGPPELHEGGS